MFRTTALATGLTLAALLHHANAVDKTRDPELISQLITVNSQLDRLALLKTDEDWFFDFNIQQPFYNFSPGGVVNMNSATFPAAKGNGMTMAMLNLGPCSMLPMHYHARAANYVVAIHGNTTTYMYEENGARLVTEHLQPGQATIFPQASIHMMINTGCENSQLVSALDGEDPGTVNIGSIFTNDFPFELVNAALGQDLASEEVKGKIPDVGTGSSWGPKSCLDRCGITKPSS